HWPPTLGGTVFLANHSHGLHLPANNHRHTPFAWRNRLLHEPPPFSHHFDRVLECKSTNADQRAIFSETMTGDKIGTRRSFRLENTQGGNRRRKNRRLGIFSQVEI